MKRTTIMADENMLYELEHLAKMKAKPFAAIVREALAIYIANQKQVGPLPNPLLALAGLGSSEQVSDMANGGDEILLRDGVQSIYGWSSQDDRSH